MRSNRLWNSFLEQKFTDISLKVPEEPGSRALLIRCHRVILSRTPWFSKQIQELGNSNKVIEVQKINAKMLLHILGYAYTDLCDFFSFDSVRILEEIDESDENSIAHSNPIHGTHLDIAHNPNTPSEVLNEVRLHLPMLAEAALELDFQQMVDRMNEIEIEHSCQYRYLLDENQKLGGIGPIYPENCALVLQNYSPEDFKYCIEKAYSLERTGHLYLPVSQIAQIIASDNNTSCAEKTYFYDEAIKSCPEFTEDLIQSLKHELCLKAMEVKQLQERIN